MVLPSKAMTKATNHFQHTQHPQPNPNPTAPPASCLQRGCRGPSPASRTNNARYTNPMSTWKCLQPYESHINRIAGLASAVFAIASIIAVATLAPKTLVPGIITGAWIIIPPVVFWAEWYLLIDHTIDGNSEHSKNGIDIKRNIWAALSVLLILLYTR